MFWIIFFILFTFKLSENENVEAKPKKAKAATESKKTAEKASPKKSKPVKKETESS